MPIQQLPRHPSLENLRKQAKSLHHAVISKDPAALSTVREFRPQQDLQTFRLSTAQLVLARSYDFPSWTKLKEYVQVVGQRSFNPPTEADEAEPPADRFVRYACLDYQSDHVSRRVRARELFDANQVIADDNFYAAVTVGKVSTVKVMLEHQPALATRRGGPHNWEPILYAAYSRFDSKENEHSTLEVSKLLLRHGADPNAFFLWDGEYLFTALTGVFGEGERGPTHQPQHQYCLPLARLLLEAGADPNDSQTLYNRMFTGGIEHLELLFEFGLGSTAKASWFNSMGQPKQSPAEMLQQQLAWAAKYGQFERARLLVEHGVDVNQPDSRFNRPPLELATLHGNKRIADYLLDHGAKQVVFDPLDDFAAACLAGNEDKVNSMLKLDGKLLEKLGGHRVDLLQLAAESGKFDAIRLMAKLGFDLNAVKRTTALHHAAMTGNVEMAKLLIELGADPLVRDEEFNAFPRGWAEFGQKLEVAEFLKQFEEGVAESN
jgi:ankyrin repeat protein